MRLQSPTRDGFLCNPQGDVRVQIDDRAYRLEENRHFLGIWQAQPELPAAYNVNQEPVIFAVFDFGGGTFDLSILEMGAGVLEVLATGGNTYLVATTWIK